MTPSSFSNLAGHAGGHGGDALSVMRAQEIIRESITPVHVPERVALHDALDRVLCESIVSPINVPAHDNSAMDGYALRSSDLKPDADIILRVAGATHAGSTYNGVVGHNECVRIMTGAAMPTACDTVVPQELVRHASESAITIPAGAIHPGENRRLRGEDLRAGEPALRKGKILRPADLGLIASLGIVQVPVQRRLRVAFFSTGNELRSLGETPDEGCIYDSNRYTIHGMLTRLGCEPVDMGIVKDDPAALEAALRSACENADAIITSGGVSVGEADYTKQIMEKLGDVAFWQIAMRPGRPLAFGRITSEDRRAWLFGLPGNPVAAMVSFYCFVREALLHMMGADIVPLPLMHAISASAIRKKTGRTEYQRGVLSAGPDGRPQVRLTGSQGSGILRSMSEANCLIVLRHDQASVDAGEEVGVMLFEGLY
jgi:molybdopterin molybdotransferase